MIILQLYLTDFRPEFVVVIDKIDNLQNSQGNQVYDDVLAIGPHVLAYNLAQWYKNRAT